MKKRDIEERGVQDSGRLQSVEMRDGHEAPRGSKSYSGGQRVIYYSGHKSVERQASWRSQKEGLLLFLTSPCYESIAECH